MRKRKGTSITALHGVLVINKGAGPTSNKVLQQVRRVLGGVKAGHSGTLDPEAEGVLLLCLGQATKLVPFLAGLEKEYLGRMKFGGETDTQDASGRVIARAPVAHLTEGNIREAMGTFLGESYQQPPMFSAVKVKGERLYQLARRGEVVPRRLRPVFLSEFTLLEWRGPEAEFLVRCSGGTYVRTLCHDLGKRCGSAGHLTGLTRNAVGPFRLEVAKTVEEIQAVALGGLEGLPIIHLADCLPHIPALRIGPEESRRVRHGQYLRPSSDKLPAGLVPGGSVRLVDAEGGLAAVARFVGASEPMPLLRVFS